MSAPSRRQSVIAMLAVSVAGLTYYGAGVHSRFGPGELPARWGELDECSGNDDELERRRQVLMSRVGARVHAIQQLLAGRMTLCEAALRFRAIERELPVTWGPQPTPGGPEESEHLCRDVIARAHAWLEANLPADADAVAARLEAELQQLRGTDGVVRLRD
jgi:hypothetical protein